MIGVIATYTEMHIVSEFFQLFKSSWEPWRPGKNYDVIVATRDYADGIKADLVIVYSSRKLAQDEELNLYSDKTIRNDILDGSQMLRGRKLVKNGFKRQSGGQHRTKSQA